MFGCMLCDSVRMMFRAQLPPLGAGKQRLVPRPKQSNDVDEEVFTPAALKSQQQQQKQQATKGGVVLVKGTVAAKAKPAVRGLRTALDLIPPCHDLSMTSHVLTRSITSS